MQESQVWSLVWEDSTGCEQAKLMQHTYWASALDRALQEKPLQWEVWAPQLESSSCLPQREKAGAPQQRPCEAKIK